MVGEEGGDCRVCGASLKICTVSVAEETHSSVDAILKAMLNILAGIEPRLNWYSLPASGTEKTRMIVPLSEAVASFVPSLLKAMHERGDLCASTTFIASSLIVSKIMTSPDVGAICALFGGACEGGAKDDSADFRGKGYAR